MLDDMFGKLQNMQAQMQESQKKLNEILVEAEQADGKIKVVCTAAKNVKDISIDEAILKSSDKEEIEDLLVLALNEALQKAEEIASKEMSSFGSDMLPDGLKGLF